MSVVRFAGQGSAIFLGLLTAVIGCSDPVSPAPMGAFNVTFGNSAIAGVTCPATSPDAILRVGNVTDTGQSALTDGDDGAIISCSVAKLSSGYRASGSIIRGTSEFRLASVDLEEGVKNTGLVSVSGLNTVGKAYGPNPATPCNFEIIEASEGRLWMSWDCPLVASGSSDSEQCALYNGYLFFDNCQT